MLNFPCLILDHDDTVVRSEATVNYPACLQSLAEQRPGVEMTLEQFSRWTFQEGYIAMFVNHFDFTREELLRQFAIWQDFVKTHIPPAFPGIAWVLHRYKAAGGKIFAASHSCKFNIERDYMEHFGFVPDDIFGGDLPESLQKPNPYAIDQIREKYGFSPSEMLMVDDLTPGYKMAKSRGVRFAYAGWSRDYSPEIAQHMEKICDFPLKTPKDLEKILFETLDSRGIIV